MKTTTPARDDDALASLDSVRRLVGAAFLAAHLGLREHAERILAGAAAARPDARYLPIARGYLAVLFGDPDAAIRDLADLANGDDQAAKDALRVIALASATGGYNDRARSAAEQLRDLDPEGAGPFLEELLGPASLAAR